MNIALWIVQGLVAAAFLMAGIMKLTQPKEKMQDNMAWVDDFTEGQVKMIGAVEALGAIGLVLPGITGIAPVLVPLAAVGTALVMIGAIVTHVRRDETERLVVNIVFIAMATFIAWGRFGDYPL